MNNQPSNHCLITIVTVVRNGVLSLGKTIDSVAAQDYPHIEYIIIDGASTDGTLNIIKRHEHTITPSQWISEADGGIYNAMNKGAAMANGQYICFLNSGDAFADANVVSKVAENIAQHTETDIFYGNILKQNKDGSYVEKTASLPCNKHRMFFCHQSAFVRTSLMRQYPFDETYRMSADFKFFKQCCKRRRSFMYLNFPVVIYDFGGISNTDRIAGLRENARVVRETDRGWNKIVFLLRLYFVICMLRLRKTKRAVCRTLSPLAI
jgi:glycosyltransferase involved in cell wall biosynthesis